MMADEADYYTLLDVPLDADEATIRLAFRRLARRYHPDVAGTGSVERMRQLNSAYQTLSDPQRRRAYDAERLAIFGHTTIQPSSPTTPRSTSTTSSPPSSAARVGAVRHSAGPFQRVATLDAGEDIPIVSIAFARGGALAGIGQIDGQARMWDVPTARLATTLSFGNQGAAGVLQELRLSPGGHYAAAWGFQLGTRIWRVDRGETIWNVGIHGPSGVMDAALFDEPPLVRLALPDAPLALADDDPFRWAHEGRGGTAVFSRPLRGPVSAAWAVPLRCLETSGGGLFADPPDARWRIHQRVLSANGRLLFTFSTGATARLSPARILHIWELDRRTILGASQARRLVRLVEPVDQLDYPLALTPDLSWVAIPHERRALTLYAPRKGTKRFIPTGELPEDARCALTDDGEYVAIARENHLDVWEARDGRHIEQWQFSTEVTALAFASASERPLLGVGLRNGLVEMWA